MNVTVLVDSRFRGNDRLSYVIIIERFTVAFDSKTISLSSKISCYPDLFKHFGQIFIHVADRFDVVVLYEDLQHVRTDKRRQARSEPYVLDSQMQ